MQSVCMGRSRPEEFLGPFFLATAGILVTRGSMVFTALLKASRGSMAAQAFTGHHGAFPRPREASRRRSASPPAQILVTGLTLVTALVTALVTSFSSNSYVFL